MTLGREIRVSLPRASLPDLDPELRLPLADVGAEVDDARDALEPADELRGDLLEPVEVVALDLEADLGRGEGQELGRGRLLAGDRYR